MNLISRYLNRISGGAYRQNKEFILTFLERNEEARVLDIGCGEGDLSLEVMNTVGGMLYGVEVLEKYALRAHTNGINVVMANVDKGLPFRDESFDVLVSNQVLEHVSDTDNFIRECYRVLRYGGACVLSTPNLASIHNIVALILGYQPFATGKR